MITFDEKLIITKQVNEIVCRYAKKVVIKKMLFEFSFPDGLKDDLSETTINPLLETLVYYQGDYYPDTLLEVTDFIHSFLQKLDENDIISLYFLTINKNFNFYTEDFEVNDGSIINNENEFNAMLGKELAYRIYEPEGSGLQDEMEKMLQDFISNFSCELFDFDNIEQTINLILETIELKSNESVSRIIYNF